MRFYCDEPLLSSQPWGRRQVRGKVKASLFSTNSQTPMNSQPKLLLLRVALCLQPHLRPELHSAGHNTAFCMPREILLRTLLWAFFTLLCDFSKTKRGLSPPGITRTITLAKHCSLQVVAVSQVTQSSEALWQVCDSFLSHRRLCATKAAPCHAGTGHHAQYHSMSSQKSRAR